jgi:N-methylhydantoinase A
MASSNIAAAVRLVSTARGIDPRDYTLVAYGGAGPVHAALVAEQLGMRRVLVPWSPGLVSAFGLLVADPTVDLVHTRIHRLGDDTLDPATVARLREEALGAAARHGLDADRSTVSLAIDARYGGQAFELTVPLDMRPASPAEIREAFGHAHRQRYGYALADRPVEVVGYRVRVAEASPADLVPPGPGRDGPPRVEPGTITLDGRPLRAGFAERRSLPPGHRLPGPSVVEEATATTLVPAGWSATVLEDGDLLIERSA